jgi:hypothetical protein
MRGEKYICVYKKNVIKISIAFWLSSLHEYVKAFMIGIYWILFLIFPAVATSSFMTCKTKKVTIISVYATIFHVWIDYHGRKTARSIPIRGRQRFFVLPSQDIHIFPNAGCWPHHMQCCHTT